MEKILVIGLDGADLDVLRPYLESGALPNLAGIVREGASGYLRSVLPPVSAPAWATFMTGRRPGRHGLFGFVSECEDGAGTRLAEYGRIRGEKLWDLFSAAGRRVVVLNVPITWPPPAVDGAFVSGMLSPPGRPFTFPPGLEKELARKAPGYRIDIDRHLFSDRPAFLAHLHRVVAARAAAALDLMDTVEWDLFVAVFTSTDRIQHHFWRRDRREILRLFARVDSAVGEMLARAGEKATVLVVSDHGFTSTDRRFYANRWLKHEGYLVTRRARGNADDYRRRRFNWFMGEPEEARRPEPLLRRVLFFLGLSGDEVIDWGRTRAYLYSSDTRGIHVNLAGRQPRGVVPDAHYEHLRDEIVTKLRALRFPETDEPVFEQVVKREDLYEGPYVEDAPDILLEPQGDRYRVVTRVPGDRFFRQHRRPGGYHRRAGLLLAKGPGIRRGIPIEGAALEDVMPTVLFLAGLPIPDRVDGRVLEGLVREDVLCRIREERAPAAPDRDPDVPVDLTAEEDDVLRRQLEDLGYL